MIMSFLSKKGFEVKRNAFMHRVLRLCLFAGISLVASTGFAQSNEIQSIQATQQGAVVSVKVVFAQVVETQPAGFSMKNPDRVVVDFANTNNKTGHKHQKIGLGGIKDLRIVQAGDRSRLVLNLSKTRNFSTHVDGKVVTVKISEAARKQVAAPQPATQQVKQIALSNALQGIDFRRGSEGEGRVVIDFPHSQVAADVRQKGDKIFVDIDELTLPDALRRRLDVTDFGTPVKTVTTQQKGKKIRMQIASRGLWEYTAFQSDQQLVIDVKPIKEDPNKLTQGTQGYRGEKLSLSFQDIEVRAILQVIADFTGLNIIASDTVGGTLTIHLKNVPWDQALDVVMRAKNLDMRKNGTVLWIAPKDELLSKEKAELQQEAEIEDLLPMKMEAFQLNYQKAESFNDIFGIDDDSSSGDENSILSKRGSAVIDPRTNQLFVTDVPSRLENIRRLVAKVDIPSRQVMIEARIVEADDSFSRNLGVKLGFMDFSDPAKAGGGSGLNVSGNYLGVGEQTGVAEITDGSYIPNTQFLSMPASAINGTSAASIGISIFNNAADRFLNLELSALEADGKGKVISSPRVVTADQTKAIIEQGTELPYQEATSSGATSVSFRKASLKLEVTPQITPDGNVILDVDVNKDTVGESTTSGIAINTKHVKTQVLVENGGTVVLGGIFSQTKTHTKTQVPLLGDIPVLGYLFQNNEVTDDKTELLIFITPKIITDHFKN